MPIVRGTSPFDATNSGEEYELLIATPVAIDEHAFAREFGVPLTRVGTASAPGTGEGMVRIAAKGRFVDLPSGHDHFSI